MVSDICNYMVEEMGLEKLFYSIVLMMVCILDDKKDFLKYIVYGWIFVYEFKVIKDEYSW